MKRAFLASIVFASLAIAAYPQGHSVSGYVRDQNSSAVSEAKVAFTATDSQTVSTVTDESGFFHFENISSPSGHILISAAGFQMYKGEWSGLELNIVLVPIAISEKVTVTRTEARLGDTPQSVLVLQKSELSSSAAPTIDDKLRQVPGFTLFRRSGSRTANPTSQGVSLRGTGGSGASRAAVTLDGFSLNDPFGGWVCWGRIPIESIHSVEVLRGSAGELFGNSAIGGIIAVSSKHAEDGNVLDVDLSAGSEDSASGSLFTSLPYKKWNGTLAAEGFSTNGFIPVAMEQRGTVDSAANVSRSTFSPLIEYRLNKAARFFAGGEYFQERRNNGSPLQTNDTKIYNLRTGIDLLNSRLGDLAFRGWLLSEIYHQSFSSIALDRNSEVITRLQTVPSGSQGASLQWSRALSTKGSIFAGTEFRIVRGSSDERAFAAGRPTSFINAGGREVTNGFYAGGSYLPSDRVVLSGGVRADQWREYSAYSDTRPLTSAATARGVFPDRSEMAFSPRASALFRINENISITGTISKGFRQPTLNELYRSFRVGNVLTLANENLRAERSTTGEGGVLISALGDRLYVRSVGFCTNIDEPVSNVTLTSTPSLITRQRQNLGNTRSCGIETDSQFRVRNDLNFSAGYLFVNAKVRRFPADRALEGLKVPQVAQNQFTFQLRYSNSKFANVSVQMRASDSQFDDDQNLFRLSGFASFDIFASRHINRAAEVYLAAENIFGERIEAGRTPVLTLTDPRTIRAGVRFTLGHK